MTHIWVWLFSKSNRATLVGILRQLQELGYKLICISSMFQSIYELLLFYIYYNEIFLKKANVLFLADGSLFTYLLSLIEQRKLSGIAGRWCRMLNILELTCLNLLTHFEKFIILRKLYWSEWMEAILICPVLEKLIRQMKTGILEYLGNSYKQKTEFSE